MVCLQLDYWPLSTLRSQCPEITRSFCFKGWDDHIRTWCNFNRSSVTPVRYVRICHIQNETCPSPYSVDSTQTSITTHSCLHVSFITQHRRMEESVSDFDGVLLYQLIGYRTGTKGISKVNWNKMSFKFSLKKCTLFNSQDTQQTQYTIVFLIALELTKKSSFTWSFLHAFYLKFYAPFTKVCQ